MSDLIKREDAMQVAFLYPFFSDALMEEIKAIPSADIDLSEYSDKLWKNAYERGKADRPQGEWKNYKYEHYCTNCGEVVIGDWYTEDEWYDFCPNCGAQMKGADDE